MSEQSLKYIREYYAVPAEIGRRVVVDGKPGIITGAKNAYILVLFDKDKPGNTKPCHPTWKVEYGKMGKTRKMARSQQRYQEYLNSESNLTFAEYLGIGKSR
jgi:hypothetical protein